MNYHKTYLHIGSFRRLTLIGEGHVGAKPQGVGLVVNVHLGEEHRKIW